MSIMEWADYYDRFYDWSENTRVRRMCELTNIGTAEEITDIALEFENDKNASKLIRKALSMGIHFSPQNITELLLTIDETTIKQMIKSFEGEFTREWLEEIEFYIDSATYNDLEARLLKKKQNYYCKRERTSTIDQRTEGDTTLAYINDALNVYFSNTDLNKKRKKRSKPKIISALLSLRKMSRTTKKIFSTPPTTKQKIAQQRSKRRRNRPWWDR